MELSAQKRSVTGKGVRALRQEGKMPAVIYGTKEETLSIQVDSKDFTKVLKEAGESSVITLSIEGTNKDVLIHDVDRDPVTDIPRHADFYAVQKGQKVEVSVPLEFVGEAPAVKELGANLIKVVHEIEIEAEAVHLPHQLEVDVSTLVALDSHITAKEITLPVGVTLITDPEETIVNIAMPEEEKEEEVPEGPDMEAIGISEDRGKKDGDTPLEGEAKPEGDTDKN